jgi:large subunit ribosomal protein L17
MALSKNIKNGKKGKKKMRHRKSGKKLGRTWEHRKAMFRNMAKSLIVHERIRTTVPKARELSRIMDKLITLAVRNDLSAKRQAYKVLENHKLVQKLFNEIGPKFSSGKGGYTRVVKFATPRVGDSAAMALIEFTFFESQAEEKAKPKKAVKPVAQEAKAALDESAAIQADEAVSEPESDAPEAQPVAKSTEASDEEKPLISETPDPEVEKPEPVSNETPEPDEEQPAAEESPDKDSRKDDQPEGTEPEKEK